MTNVILGKLEKKKEEGKNRKLWISRSKSSSKFQEGVLNLSKNFMKNINKNPNHNKNKIKPGQHDKNKFLGKNKL
jgi:hypothetical protein